ncbi:MAG TPA: hypothetical protein VE981_16000 [Planctomycetota bacterium]|nr:hypothetical protein [Planctomycetota bacterium]
MRPTLAILVCLFGAAQAQDAPPGGPPTYSVSVEQGWKLSADGEVDFPNVQENDLVSGLTPKFTLKTSMNWPARDRDGRVMVKPKGFAAWKTNGDPLKLEATISIHPDGACQMALKKIDYVERLQRATIEFDGDKVRTVDFGGKGKWQGSRAEWSGRVATIETAIRDMYFRAVTPQKPAGGKETVGLDIAGDTKAAWRLFVTTSLEDQLAVLILCRLDGLRLEKDRWPAEIPAGPSRPKQLARSLIDRIQAQARGTFATEAAKGKPGQLLKDKPWKSNELVIPTPGWMDGKAWAAERMKPLEEAHERLRSMTEETNGKNSTTKHATILDPGVWRTAVETETKNLRQGVLVEIPREPLTFDTALYPRTRNSGNATYDFKEKSSVQDGVLQTSDAEVSGFVPELEVIFFYSGADMNVWRGSLIRMETWYKGRLKRE